MENTLPLSNVCGIDLIIGPMFAGKTSELLRRLNIYSTMGLNCIFINSSLDTRSDKDFSSHNPLVTSISDNFCSMKLNDIENNRNMFKQYDVIGIDEAQLFPAIKEEVLFLTEHLNKKVIVSGLNGDFKRQKFGEILDLVPLCDNITKLHPFCLPCCKNRKIKSAQFTKRIVQDSNYILIGALDSYIPVCRECYNN